MKLLATEGIEFRMNTNFDTNQLTSDNHDSNFDAYCICTGAETPRDLNIPGRELKGIHFALEMLSQQNRIIEGENFPKEALVNAKTRKYWSSVAEIPVLTVSAPAFVKEQPA